MSDETILSKIKLIFDDKSVKDLSSKLSDFLLTPIKKQKEQLRHNKEEQLRNQKELHSKAIQDLKKEKDIKLSNENEIHNNLINKIKEVHNLELQNLKDKKNKLINSETELHKFYLENIEKVKNTEINKIKEKKEKELSDIKNKNNIVLNIIETEHQKALNQAKEKKQKQIEDITLIKNKELEKQQAIENNLKNSIKKIHEERLNQLTQEKHLKMQYETEMQRAILDNIEKEKQKQIEIAKEKRNQFLLKKQELEYGIKGNKDEILAFERMSKQKLEEIELNKRIRLNVINQAKQAELESIGEVSKKQLSEINKRFKERENRQLAILNKEKEEHLKYIKDSNNIGKSLIKSKQNDIKQLKNEEELSTKKAFDSKIKNINDIFNKQINEQNNISKKELSDIEKKYSEELKKEKDLDLKRQSIINNRQSKKLSDLNNWYNTEKAKINELFVEEKAKENNLKSKKKSAELEDYDIKLSNLNKLYNEEKSKINSNYNLETQKEKDGHLKSLSLINEKYDKKIDRENNSYKLQKANEIDLHNKNLANIKSEHNEKKNLQNIDFQKSIENIKQVYNEAKNKLGSVFNSNFLSNSIGEFTKKYRSAVFQMSNIDEFERALTRINDRIIQETKRNLEEGFAIFRESDIYTRQIISMRGISGGAKDVLEAIRSGGQAMQPISYDTISKQSIDMANQYGQSMDKVSKALVYTVETGLEFEKAVGLVDTALMGSVATHTELQNVLKGLIKTSFQYGNAEKGYTDILEQRNKVMNMFMVGASRGSLNLADFSEQMGNISAQAKKVNSPLPETIALFSALGQQMKGAPEAGTALVNVFVKFSKQIERGKKMVSLINEELKKVGRTDLTLSLGKMASIEAGGVIPVLQKIFEIEKQLSTKQAEEFMNSIFNEIRASKGIEAIRNSIKTLPDEVRILIEETQHLNKAFAEMTQGVDFRLTSMVNRIKNNFTAIFLNNRPIINTVINQIGEYIQTWITKVINFAGQVLNPDSNISKMFFTFVNNMKLLFFEMWKTIEIVMTAVNRLFGAGGSLESATSNGNYFVEFLMRLSHWILLGAKVFNNLIQGISSLTFYLKPLITVFHNLLDIISRLPSGFFSLITVVYLSVKAIQVIGTTALATNPYLLILAGGVYLLASAFGKVTDSASDFNSELEALQNKSNRMKDMQEEYNKRKNKEIQLSKEISLLEQADNKQKNKSNENLINTLKKQIEQAKKDKTNYEKYMNKEGVPVINYNVEDINALIKKQVEIDKIFKQQTDKLNKGGALTLPEGGKGSVNSNKQKIVLRNRLDEIEDIYKNHISNVEELFSKGEINKEQRLIGMKVADTFKIVALNTLEKGKEVKGGYLNFLKQIKSEVTNISDINKSFLGARIRKEIGQGTGLNKDELRKLSNQKTEILKREGSSYTHYAQQQSLYELDMIKEDLLDKEIKRNNLITKNNIQYSERLLKSYKDISKEKQSIINDEKYFTVQKLKELSKIEEQLNSDKLKSRKQDTDKIRQEITSEKQKLSDKLLDLETEELTRINENKKKLLNRNREELLISEYEYQQESIKLDEDALNKRIKIFETNNNKLSLSPEKLKQETEDILKTEQEIQDKKLENKIKNELSYSNFALETIKNIMQNENLSIEKRQELYKSFFKFNRSSIEELISDTKLYYDTLSNIYSNTYNKAKEAFSGFKDITSSILDLTRNNFRQINSEIKELMHLSENTSEIFSNISDKSFEFVNNIKNLNSQIKSLENSKLEKTKEEIEKISEKIAELQEGKDGAKDGFVIAIAIELTKESLRQINHEIDRISKYGVKSFEDFSTTVSNIFFSSFGLVFELLANLVGQSFKKNVSGQTDELVKIMKNKIKDITDNWNKLVDDVWDKAREFTDKISGKENELRDLKIESYKKEQKLIDDLFKSQMDKSKEKIRQIKKEKEEEIKAITEVKNLREKRSIDQQRKQNAVKTLNQQLENKQFDEGFYRQTSEEFKTNIEFEKENIRNKYETLGEISFEEFQSRNRELAIKQVAYYRRRLQGSDNPELAKIIEDEKALKTKKSSLEKAKLIANLNKDNIKSGELDTEISNISNELINLQQLKEGNSLLKYRTEISKDLNSSTNDFYENYYDSEMESAELSDKTHKENVKALDKELEIEESNLSRITNLYNAHTDELFKVYNNGTDEWFKGIEKRQGIVIKSARDLYDSFSLKAMSELSKLNNSNISVMSYQEQSIEKLKSYFIDISTETDNVKNDISKIISDLNSGIKSIQDARLSGKSLLSGYSSETGTQAQAIKQDLRNTKEQQSKFVSENSNILKNTTPSNKDAGEESREQIEKTRQDYLLKIGITKPKQKAIDNLINKFGINETLAFNSIKNAPKQITASYLSSSLNIDPKKANKIISDMQQNNLINDIINAMNSVTNKLNISPFADGGIIDKPTLALMGERGNETIFNARQMRNLYNQINNNSFGSSGTSNSINISINNPVVKEASDINKLADIVSKKITKELTRQI